MIFYFTGTGNSLHAAKALLEPGEKLVSIAEALQRGESEYTLAEPERVGFVFPVYFYTVPEIVRTFLDGLTLHGAGYVFAVITCGGGISQAGGILKKCLRSRGLELQYVSSLLMPDNSMLFYQIPPVSEAGPRLAAAENRLAEIAAELRSEKALSISGFAPVSALIGKGYALCRSTAKFHALDSCIGCGLCEKNCPEKAIRLERGKPVWIRNTCCKCSACINRCPVSAIQYGKATQKRNRYVHPDLTAGSGHP